MMIGQISAAKSSAQVLFVGCRPAEGATLVDRVAAYAEARVIKCDAGYSPSARRLRMADLSATATVGYVGVRVGFFSPGEAGNAPT